MKRLSIVGVCMMVVGMSVVYAANSSLSSISGNEQISTGSIPQNTPNTSVNIQLTGNYTTYDPYKDYTVSPIKDSIGAYIQGTFSTALWGDFSFDNISLSNVGEDTINCANSDPKKTIKLQISQSPVATSSYWGNYTFDSSNSYYCPFSGMTESGNTGGKMVLIFLSNTLGGPISVKIDNFNSITPRELGGLTFNGVGNLSANNNIQKTTTDNIRYLEGTTSRFQAKTAVNKNIASLTANKKIDNNTTPPDLASSGDRVFYYKNPLSDINISGAISGKKTVIVEGGNVTINSNMWYTDTNSFLVLIVKSGGDTTKGKITIDGDVTNVVGTLISDGPLLASGTSYKQLLIYGSIFTANTIGGSVNKTECPYGTEDYGSSCTPDKAKLYDLARFRDFTLVPENTLNLGDTCIGGSNNLVPTNGNTLDSLPGAWAGGGSCADKRGTDSKLKTTTKTNPLVIEYNPMIKTSGMKILDMK